MPNPQEIGLRCFLYYALSKVQDLVPTHILLEAIIIMESKYMTKIQWHPSFCSALRLEFKDYPTLEFTQEYNLSNKPIQVDMLIIKKPENLHLANSIGEFFKAHNIIEYKSPTDHKYNHFAIDQTLAYGYYYKQKALSEDVTITLVVSKNHFNIIKWLNSRRKSYVMRHNGIYTVNEIFGLAFQICIIEELVEDEFNWITKLSNKLSINNIRDLVTNTKNLLNKSEFDYAKSIVDTVFKANEKLLSSERKEVEGMDVLEKIFAEELDKIRTESEVKGEIKGEAKGRIGLISQFISDYGIEKAKTMLKPSEKELEEALAML